MKKKLILLFMTHFHILKLFGQKFVDKRPIQKETFHTLCNVRYKPLKFLLLQYFFKVSYTYQIKVIFFFI